jgi:ribosomal protein S18 acetylase RimI-like enzyme
LEIRHYQPGDETDQASVYNTAAGGLPGFKPATPEEIARRFRSSDPDPATKWYAVQGGTVVGYVVCNPNGRMSYPWCLSTAREAREALMKTALDEVADRGETEVWAAYRHDWQELIRFFKEHGFHVAREMINYIAPLESLPDEPVPEGRAIGPLARSDIPRALELGRGLFRSDDPNRIEGLYLESAHFDPSCAYALKRTRDGETLGVALAIVSPRFSDPNKVDAAMPCFRLGSLGTEGERHLRVNGLFSCVFSSEETAVALLGEAVRRFIKAGLTHAAAQAPSDRPDLCAFYDRFFQRQGSFPILVRSVTRPSNEK